MKKGSGRGSPDTLEKEQAAAMARLVREEYRAREDAQPEPDNLAGWVIGFFGFPVKASRQADLGFPFVTVSLCLVLVATFVWSYAVNEGLVHSLGLVPRNWSSLGGTTLLTSAFLHSGVLHLLVSIYFIAAYGSEVEIAMGRWKYLAVWTICAAAGGVGFVLLSSGCPAQLKGADGAVSGVLGLFAVLNPGRRVRIMIVSTIVRWAVMPSWVFLIFWMLGLIFVDSRFLSPDWSIAISAHFGGLLMGLLLGFAWRAGGRRNRYTHGAVQRVRGWL